MGSPSLRNTGAARPKSIPLGHRIAFPTRVELDHFVANGGGAKIGGMALYALDEGRELILGEDLTTLLPAPGASLFAVDPSAPAETGTLFQTFEDAFAAAKEAPGLVHIAIMSNTTVPAGAYDFERRISIVANLEGAANIKDLTLSDGVTFVNLAHAMGGLRMISLSSAPIITASSTLLWVIERGVQLSAMGTAPFVTVPAATVNTMVMREAAQFNATAEKIIELQDPTSVCNLLLFGNSVILNSVEGPGVLVIAYAGAAPSFTPQPSHTGTLVEAFFTKSVNVGHTATGPGNWVGAPPDNVGDAIDRMAAVVAGAHGAIP